MQTFEERKRQHIQLSLDPRNQAVGGSGLDYIKLRHCALPELDFSEIELKLRKFNRQLLVPFFVSSMTAGHSGANKVNIVLAKACQRRGWAMGVGSQRRQLSDPLANQEWMELRKQAPQAVLFGNLGISQLISTAVDDVQRLVDSLGATAMIIHTNPLQECLQPEGTPVFKGGISALGRLCRNLNVPVILKETGCGISREVLEALRDSGLSAIDVAGFGGTHWGRIEGQRSESYLTRVSESFRDWGISTVDSVVDSVEAKKSWPELDVWASGGVRSGLDAAKLFALGADMVGFAQPLLEATLKGEKELEELMQQLEYELAVALFCTGCRSIFDLREKKVWQWTR